MTILLLTKGQQAEENDQLIEHSAWISVDTQREHTKIYRCFYAFTANSTYTVLIL